MFTTKTHSLIINHRFMHSTTLSVCSFIQIMHNLMSTNFLYLVPYMYTCTVFGNEHLGKKERNHICVCLAVFIEISTELTAQFE